jgi:hypothetical protein
MGRPQVQRRRCGFARRAGAFAVSVLACTETAPRVPGAGSRETAAPPENATPPVPAGTARVEPTDTAPGSLTPPESGPASTLPLGRPPPGTGAASGTGSEPSVSPRHIEIVGRQLLVDGQPILLRGVCWNPVPVGAIHPEGLDFAGFAERDAAQMQELGINVVRTYEPLLDGAVLDRFAAAGIFVINSVYPWGGAPAEVVVERVRAVRNHPALLMWAVGNEWNYNGLYVGLSHEDSVARLNQAAALIKAEDPLHPVATIYGELPSPDTLAAMPDIDVWGINAYRGISFGDLFESWRARSSAPMFLSEYGADAYNASLPGYDPDSQAQAVAALTRELFANSSRSSATDGASLGGTLFEWADEWWKHPEGSLSEHDVGGAAPGGGPYPDQVFNEEWWGIVDIQRVARPAFSAIREVYAEARAR